MRPPFRELNHYFNGDEESAAESPSPGEDMGEDALDADDLDMS